MGFCKNNNRQFSLAENFGLPSLSSTIKSRPRNYYIIFFISRSRVGPPRAMNPKWELDFYSGLRKSDKCSLIRKCVRHADKWRNANVAIATSSTRGWLLKFVKKRFVSCKFMIAFLKKKGDVFWNLYFTPMHNDIYTIKQGLKMASW